MKLLKFENFQVLPTDEAFLVKPIRDLFNKDTSDNKETFMKQISFIYHYVDPRSSYADIIDDTERFNKIIKQEGLPKSFKPSKELEKAIEIYKELTTTTSLKLLTSMRTAINKISEFLENVDLFALDEKGKPMYPIQSITAATDKVPQLAKRLQETEMIVSQEIMESSRIRGGEDSDHAFEDGF